MTQRFVFFWLKELNFFYMTQRIELFSVWIEELNLVVEYDSKNRTFFECDSKNWTLFKIWLKELNFLKNVSKNWTFFRYDSKNWTLLLQKKRLIELNMTQKDWTLLKDMSQRIVPLKYESQNCPLFSTWLKELSPFWKYVSKNWTFFFKKKKWL